MPASSPSLGAPQMLDMNAHGRVSLPECAAAVMGVFK